MNESCYAYEWDMSHIWLIHVTRMNGSPYTWMSRVPCMSPHIQACNWVTAYMGMSHVTHTNESCHMYEWFRSHVHLQIYRYAFMATFRFQVLMFWSAIGYDSYHTPTHMIHITHPHTWGLSHVWMSHITRMKSHATRTWSAICCTRISHMIMCVRFVHNWISICIHIWSNVIYKNDIYE